MFFFLVREQCKELTKKYDKSENDLKALQSVGQVNTFKPFLYLTCSHLEAVDTIGNYSK